MSEKTRDVLTGVLGFIIGFTVVLVFAWLGQVRAHQSDPIGFLLPPMLALTALLALGMLASSAPVMRYLHRGHIND